jgi:hypothetical protein
MSKMNMASHPNLGFLDKILYLKREQVENYLLEAFVMEIAGTLRALSGKFWL